MNIREANVTDAPGIARVHVDTWRSAYRAIIPQSFLDELSYEQRARQWERTLRGAGHQEFVYVAENEARQIIAFASGGSALSKEPSLYTGELFAIYILDAYQRQGLGQRLFFQVVERLLTLQLTSMLIWFLAENSARRFYEKLGGVLVQTDTYRIAGAELEQVAYGWPDITQFVRLS